MKQITGSID